MTGVPDRWSPSRKGYRTRLTVRSRPTNPNGVAASLYYRILWSAARGAPSVRSQYPVRVFFCLPHRDSLPSPHLGILLPSWLTIPSGLWHIRFGAGLWNGSPAAQLRSVQRRTVSESRSRPSRSTSGSWKGLEWSCDPSRAERTGSGSSPRLCSPPPGGSTISEWFGSACSMP